MPAPNKDEATDKIIAAIFAASMCQGKPDAREYYRAYDECLEIVAERKAASRKPPFRPSKETLDDLKRRDAARKSKL